MITGDIACAALVGSAFVGYACGRVHEGSRAIKFLTENPYAPPTPPKFTKHTKVKRIPPSRAPRKVVTATLADIQPRDAFVLIHTDGTRTRFLANSIAVDGSIAATFADGALEGQKCEVIPGPGMRLEVEEVV